MKYIFNPFRRIIFATCEGCVMRVKNAEIIENPVEFLELNKYFDFVKLDFRYYFVVHLLFYKIFLIIY